MYLSSRKKKLSLDPHAPKPSRTNKEATDLISYTVWQFIYITVSFRSISKFMFHTLIQTSVNQQWLFNTWISVTLFPPDAFRPSSITPPLSSVEFISLLTPVLSRNSLTFSFRFIQSCFIQQFYSAFIFPAKQCLLHRFGSWLSHNLGRTVLSDLPLAATHSKAWHSSCEGPSIRSRHWATGLSVVLFALQIFLLLIFFLTCH